MKPFIYINTAQRGVFRRSAAGMLLGGALLTAALVCASAAEAPKQKAKKSPAAAGVSSAANLKPVVTPVRLAYQYKAGDVRRYKVTGLFNGHIPPFSSAGSPPIHLMLVLDYAATVKSADEKGAVIEYNIENAEVSLLEDDPGPSGKIDPDKVAPFPVPLSQIQKTLNVTATLKPDGSVSDIKGGDTSSVKIDLGIDLRKLFLVTAPVIFTDKPVKTGEDWSFSDGLLGSKPGKTTYTGRLLSVKAGDKRLVTSVGEQAEANVDNQLDKEGNSTEKAGDVVGSLAGKVTLTGTTQFLSSPDASAGGAAGYAGRMTDGKLILVADLKRTLPDPDQPGKQQTTTIDVHARLFVHPIDASAKPVKKSADVTKTGNKATKKDTNQQ